MIYANENDGKASHWLRCLPLGIDCVDDRSIVDVEASDLDGHSQCHFFAGIGGWPYAMELAGWPRDLPAWTGSCPCQPFSVAGKSKGTDDERHLWPEWLRLIEVCRPAVVFGEQVASPAGREWYAGVSDQVERLGYQVGAADLCAASVGAPHARQRIYWFAVDPDAWLGNSYPDRLKGREKPDLREAPPQSEEERRADPLRSSPFVGLGNSECLEPGWNPGSGTEKKGRTPLRSERDDAGASSPACGLADNESMRRRQTLSDDRGSSPGDRAEGRPSGSEPSVDSVCVRRNDAGFIEARAGGFERASYCHHWRFVDYLACRDGKIRPVECGSFPLANGVSGRVAYLRGLGNAIVPQLAAEFINCSIDSINDSLGLNH